MATKEEIPEVVMEYPGVYVFRTIVRPVPSIQHHILQLIKPVLHDITLDAITEKASSKGKYLSLHITALLTSEEQRIAVYHKFHGDPNIVFSL